ncbi:hypothetical protein KVT40_004977 [Elsinoe batatas]|uniref:Uncharacterized protein n=1 Tax=Elsinoe batatas TaxID=2601811 RepID=A0A8K0PJ92_9PEZI|nr:hypothetical protein KVT40_004977 [Elsinoe batatas]
MSSKKRRSERQEARRPEPQQSFTVAVDLGSSGAALCVCHEKDEKTMDRFYINKKVCKAPVRLAYNKNGVVERSGFQISAHEDCVQHFKMCLDKSNKASLRLQVGDVFVVCNAGGGTKDVITYEIKKIDEDGTIYFGEVVSGEGALCGGEFVDKEFKLLLHRRLRARGMARLEANPQVLKDVIDYYQNNIKENFDALSSDPTVKNFSVPFNYLFEDDTVAQMRSGRMHLSCDDLQALFDPYIDRGISVVESQVNRVEQTGRRCRGVMVVGGFGQSPYLQSKMKQRFQDPGSPNEILEIISPDNGQSAIVQGVVLQAVSGGGKVISRKARVCFGVPDEPLYDEEVHGNKAETFLDRVDGLLRVKNHIYWLIKKNDDFVTGEWVFEQYKRLFSPSALDEQKRSPQGMYEKLFICDSEDPPFFVTDARVQYLGIVKVEKGCGAIHASAYNRVPETGPVQHYELPYDLRVAPEMGIMKFEFVVDNIVYGETKIDFV